MLYLLVLLIRSVMTDQLRGKVGHQLSHVDHDDKKEQHCVQLDQEKLFFDHHLRSLRPLYKFLKLLN